MAAAAIFTIDARAGGVPALARQVYGLLERAGHHPSLVFRATEAVPASNAIATAWHFASSWPVRQTTRDGLQARAVAAYPVPPTWQYGMLALSRSAVRAPLAAVVSGSSHAGLARARAGLPYVLWVATLYGDELQARADAGDAWATGLLRRADWVELEAQERLVFARASVVLAASPHTRRRIEQRWPELTGRIRDVCPAVDLDRYTPAATPPAHPTILLTARLRDPRKNVEMLAHAFARVHARRPGARLLLAGDTPDAALRALVTELGLDAVVEMAGHVPAAELPRLYQRASVFALPSRQEGLGISVQEAMACGVPVVSTRCGGPECLVADGETGRLVPNGDVEAMATALCDLLDDDRGRARMGAAARARAVERFAPSVVNGALQEAFTSAFGALFTHAADPSPAGV